MMRILVTGAAGFLGQHFVDAYRATGNYITAIDNLSGDRDYPAIWEDARAAGVVRDDHVIYECDDAEYVFQTIEGAFDIAIHLAAPVGGREKIENDPLYNADSLRLDAAFFSWAARNPKTLCVYPSSSAVYGVAYQDVEGGEALGEYMFVPSHDTWPRPDELYGFTKMAGEVLACKASNYGVKTLAIRPFSGYGEGQSFEYPVPSIAARALRREDPLTVWGSGKQTRDFIHVSDIVKATLARLDRPIWAYDTLNLGSGYPVSFRQVAELFAELVGYSPQIVTDETKPQGVGRRYANVERMSMFYPTHQLIPLRAGLERVLADVEARI